VVRRDIALYILFLTTSKRLHCTRGHTNAEFWTKVDDELASLRKDGPQQLVMCVASPLFPSVS
jgi:hypothetical protein